MKAKTKEKQNKPFYTKWCFWVIIGLILCGNIAVLIWVQNTDLKANLLTLISGWVSFIATLLIGVIAFRQSKDYKEENDKFIQEQNDIMWRQNQLGIFKQERESLSKIYDDGTKSIYAFIDYNVLKETENQSLNNKLFIIQLKIGDFIAALQSYIIHSFFYDESKKNILIKSNDLIEIVMELPKYITEINHNQNVDQNKKTIYKIRKKIVSKSLEIEELLRNLIAYLDILIYEITKLDIDKLKTVILENEIDNTKINEEISKIIKESNDGQVENGK